MIARFSCGSPVIISLSGPQNLISRAGPLATSRFLPCRPGRISPTLAGDIRLGKEAWEEENEPDP